MKNMTKVSQEDIKKVMQMPVKILLRNSIKLLKTYPSVNRDAIKRDLILDYKDGAKLTDQEEISKALEMGRKGLVHIMGYNLIRNELLSDNPTVHIDATTPIPQNPKLKKKMDEMMNNAKNKEAKYEYF
jgi:hypothetical protein